MKKEDILKYKEKYENMPKDFVERLAYLYQIYEFSKKDMEQVLTYIQKLSEAKWREINYVFYMYPEATKRPKLRTFHKENSETYSFYVDGAKSRKDFFSEFSEAHSTMKDTISTPTIFLTKAYIQTPKSMSKIETILAELELLYNVSAPDYDNIAKAYTDMVQEILIVNDCIIYKGEVEKYYSILPRVEVTVRYMVNYDCKFNKRRINNWKSVKNNDKVNKFIETIVE